jgi:hypothetical protein
MRQTPIAAPAGHHLFRPEEKHGLSIKDDVFPPSACGESEVDYALASEHPVAHRQLHRFAGRPARGKHATIGMKRGDDAKGVPNAIAKPPAATDFSDERRGYGGERVGHQDFAGGLEHEHVCVVHSAEGSANVVLRGADQTRKHSNGWRLTCAHDFVVNEKTEGRILEHGGNVIGDRNGSQARCALRIRDTGCFQKRLWRSPRGLAARPRLAFARRKGSLRVLVRERIILRASRWEPRQDVRIDSVPNDRRFTMSLPNISAAQIEWIVKQVATYIERQRLTYIRRAVPLSQSQNATMQPFFPKSTLNAVRVVVLGGERVGNPPFYGELLRMGFEAGSLPNFATMTAITFVDTVVSHEPFTNRVLFHELVHVVQYEKLGLMGFAAKYVTGFLSGGSYEAIPLEMNAYELDARFAVEPAKAFSAAEEVQAWMHGDRF